MALLSGGRFRLHWAVARRSFRRYSTYRAATFAGVFTNTVFGFVLAYVLLAVLRQRTEVGGFDAVDVVSFTFVAQGLLAAVAAYGPFELADRITAGDVVSDLYRPFDLQSWWLAQDVGRAGFQLIFRGVPPFAIAALAFDVRLPADAGVWVAFLVSLALGVFIAFAWRFVLSLTAFWLIDARGVVQLTGLVFFFFSGFIVPLTFFPDGLRAVADVLPFSAVVQLPVEVFLSKHRAAADLVPVFARQAAWLVVMLVAGRLVLARAWRRVVVQGG